MYTVEVVQTGLNLQVFADQTLPSIIQAVVDRAASIAVLNMYSEAPYKTGKTANTIRKRVSGYNAVVEPTTPYSTYIEHGTAPHIIRAKPGGVLAFKNASGNMIFTPVVHHPGTKPNPFVARTAKITADEIPKTFVDVFREKTR